MLDSSSFRAVQVGIQGTVSSRTCAVVSQIWSGKFWKGENCILHPSL